MEVKWKEDKVLGQGSFGFVRLFVNQTTKDKIALKEMKVGILDNLEASERDKVKDRLKTEIKIMWEHNHDNLVKAMSCPEDMPYTPDETVIHVWMEYCDGGDLRKGGLNRPHNCCGLVEPEIRTILAHINSGLIFLHRHHIIHRDLKPENILLKNGPNGETVYKLTDFGYAKAYDTHSYADSMVGTPQYVAPEILNSHPHGSTVDFWSFGVVAFELCTGIRPFLHLSKNPFHWVGPASDKPDDCIHIYWPESGTQHINSNTLPIPNHLSSLFSDMLTQWLQMALHHLPNKRGGLASHSSTEDAPCLMNMEQILRTRILFMVCMSTGNILEMKIKSDDSLSTVRQWLKSRGHSNPNNLYLVTDKGKIISPTDNAMDIYNAFFQPNIYTATVYLYTTVLQPSFKLIQNVLPNVKKLLAVGDDQILKDDRPTVYGHVYYHLHEFWRLFNRLTNGHKAIVSVITGIEEELRNITENNSLFVNFCQCLGASDQVIQSVSKNHQMLLNNSTSLTQLEMQCNIKESLETWFNGIERLDNKKKELLTSLSEVQKVQRESEEILTTTEVMNQRHICSEEHFKEFDIKYVKESLRLFRLVKADCSYGEMANLLQLATNKAENIIQDDFNGVDFLSVYLRLSSVLKKAKSFNSTINDIKIDCNNIMSKVCNNMWSMISTSTNRRTSANSFPTQLSESHFAATVRRNNSVSSSVSSTASSTHNIIQRLCSSQSKDASEESDGPTDMDSLLGSLKEHICQMSKTSQNVVARNKTILSRFDNKSDEKQSIIENGCTHNLSGNS